MTLNTRRTYLAAAQTKLAEFFRRLKHTLDSLNGTSRSLTQPPQLFQQLIPQQNNSWDCGIAVIAAALHIATGITLPAKQSLFGGGGMAEQLLQRLANHALDEMAITQGETQPIHQTGTRDGEPPPISECGNASLQPFIIRMTANGVLDVRVRDGDLDPQLLDLVVSTVTLEAKSRVLEAKSRAIRNMVVSVLAVAAFAFVACRRQP
ncbi:hypothetical protein B0T25DRAFT_514087 [Lasiosphaeria hispida]|uniref:Uncharacterized protein n=1 Tax=Lasiosphaeria hispida TaxID=260671 RepID=A0AAJ0ML34_9PEZI|nr:hypothetical protein B0T25DRAFT_514087 [Lasiosphaeria hispida]